MIGPLARKTLRELKNRGGSLLALVILTGLGVACFVGFLSVHRDLDGARARFYASRHLADFALGVKRAPNTILSELSRLPYVRWVEGRIRLTGRITVRGQREPVTATVVSLPRQLNLLTLTTGTFPNPLYEDHVLVNEAFGKALGLRPGETVHLLLEGEERELVVTGRARSPEYVYVLPPAGGLVPDPARTAVVYISQDLLEEWGDLDGAFNEVLGLVSVQGSQVPVEHILGGLEDKLEPYGPLLGLAQHELPSVHFLANELVELKTNATILPSLFLGVVGLVLSVVMSRQVAQQRTIIGNLRAMGYTRWAILRHYCGHGLWVGGAGGMVGLGLGRVMQTTLIDVYKGYFELPDMRAGFHPDLMVLGMTAALTAAFLGSFRSAWKAAGLAPAEAMQEAPPERGGKVLPEFLPWFWRPLPFTGKMMLRAIFRSPLRSFVTIGATVISTALLVESLSMARALDVMIAHEFQDTSHQDLTIGLSDPRGAGGWDELRPAGLSQIEPQLIVTTELRRGSRRKRVGVFGLIDDHQLHTPLDSSGKPIPIPRHGLIVTRKLAEILDAEPGDLVTLKPLVGRREETTAPVVGTVDSYMGLGAYTHIDYLSHLLGEERVANNYLALTNRVRPADRVLDEIYRRPRVTGIEERSRALRRIDDLLERSLGIWLTILIGFTSLLALGSTLNMALVSLQERAREVATLRVLGYSEGAVARIFSGESLLLNGLGVLLGLPAGYGLVVLVARAYDTELFRLPVVTDRLILAQSAGLMLLFLSLAQLVVLHMVRRTPWLELCKVRG